MILRKAIRAQGLRFDVDATDLPGRPDIVFRQERVAVFCDGDFWHGRLLAKRIERLSQGHNAAYWVEKIASNVRRDRRNDRALRRAGWKVLRFWESAVISTPERSARRVERAVLLRTPEQQRKRASAYVSGNVELGKLPPPR